MDYLIYNKVKFTHKGGTKQYFVYSIANTKTNRGLVIHRWGRIGSFGSIQVFSHHSFGDTKSAFDKKCNDRRKNGYEVIQPEDVETKNTNAIDLKNIVGQMFWSLGAKNLKHLDSDIDTTGVKEPNATTNELGQKIERSPRLVVEDEDALRREEEARLLKIKQEEEAERLREATRYQSDPTWGAFS